MAIIFYKIPLNLSAVLNGKELPTCDVASSISKNLELIIMTRFGEHRSNTDFGCEIWDLDFELIISESLWEEKLRQSLFKSITSHENRLTEIKLGVKISEIEKYSAIKQQSEIRKIVQVRLNGTIIKTGEPFTFDTSLFLSPLSVD